VSVPSLSPTVVQPYLSEKPASQDPATIAKRPKDEESRYGGSDQIESSKPSTFLSSVKWSARNYGKVAVSALALSTLYYGASHYGAIRAPRPDHSGGHDGSQLAAGAQLEQSVHNYLGAPGSQAKKALKQSVGAYTDQLIKDMNKPSGVVKDLLGEGPPSEVPKLAPSADGILQKHRIEFQLRA